MDEVERGVRKALQGVLRRADPEEMTDDAELVRDLGADSLDLVNYTFALEDQFDVELQPDEVAKVKTIGDVVAVIRQMTGEADNHG